MFFRRLLAFAFGLCMIPAIGWAEQITLKSRTSTVEIIGELKSFNSETYVLETNLGDIEVDARTVICEGLDCPKIDKYTSNISLFGTASLINKLMVPLLESYSFALDANVETNVETDVKSYIKIIAKSGQEFANIIVQSDRSKDLKADIKTTQKSLIIKSGTAKALSSEYNITPVASDALIAITSDINTIKSISLEDLKNVLSEDIDNWKDIGGPDAPINLYLPSKTTDIIQIAKDFDFDLSNAKSAIRFDDFTELSKSASNDPYGLGFVNYANHRNARPLPIVGSCGAYIRPTAFNISTGNYPTTYYHYIKTSSDNPPIFIREFLDYLADTQATSMIDRLGYPSLSVYENRLENQGNRIAHGLLSTKNASSTANFKRMLEMLNGARQLSTVLRFKTDGNDLTHRSKAALDALISELYLGNYADQSLIIAGFAESKTTSESAAKTIISYIKNADNDGLLHNLQIKSFGFGDISPLACQNTPQGKAINNRVEIWVKDAG